METKIWTIRYVAYSGDIVRTHVEADINAEESDVISKAMDEESGYSDNYIHKVIDVS
jgi:hypothetical protein